MSAFYARIAGKIFGPLDSGQLRQLVAVGKLTRDDAISKDGKTGWTPAGNVKGLFPPAELIVAADERPHPIETIVRAEPRPVAHALPAEPRPVAQALPRASSVVPSQPSVVYVQAPPSPAPTMVQQNTVVVHAPRPQNTCATLALGLGLLSFIAAFVPILGLIVIPASSLTLLLALFGFIIAFARGGRGLIGSIVGGLLAVIAMPLALTSTVVGVGGAAIHAGQAGQQARQAAEQSPPVAGDPDLPLRPRVESAPSVPPVNESSPAEQTSRGSRSAGGPSTVESTPAAPKSEATENINLRTWTSTAGTTIEAEFQSATAGNVKLKKADGTIVTVPIDKLSPEDQNFIRRGKR